MQIKGLPMPLVLYCDGYLPKKISLDRGKTTHPLPRKFWHSTREENLLQRSFQKNGIKAVLAQYGPAGVAVLNSCRDLQLPLVVHFHGYDAFREDILQHQGLHYPELFQYASAVIGVSDAMVAQLQKLGCPTAKIRKVIYGVNTSLFKPAKPNITKKYDFIACGRFVSKKAPLSVLRAFAKVLLVCPTATLVYIGEGELLTATKNLVNDLGISDHVTFTGILAPDLVAQAYQMSKCFIQHSVTTSDNDSEGTPLTILEAMASGLPVVSTIHGGIPQVVTHQVTGFLVPENDIDLMAKYMTNILEEPALASAMGAKGRDLIEQHYTKAQYLNNISSILENCIGK
ncbi:MAG: glycosyl transferase family 1 [Cytophagaceae bacterium]|nr:glycosyl transferase family 1 [Cytophagaceae bacterium]